MNIFSLIFGSDKEELVDNLEGFELRPQQMQMAEAVDDALLHKRHLIVEAGTGVGKSLAYLLPFIKWVSATNKRVVISTYTKTLQEQLFKRDLPELRDILGIDFHFALCLGSQNYLCLRRLAQNLSHDLFDSDEEKEPCLKIHKWRSKTNCGLRSDMGFSVSESIWNKINREGDLCLGKRCPFRRECFYYKARAEEFKSHILITNHHLFFSHISSGAGLLPPFEAVIFDEAHTLEDVATRYLGMEVSNSQITYFLNSLFNPRTGKGFIRKLSSIDVDTADELIGHVSAVRDAANMFFSEIADKFGNQTNSIRIKEPRPVLNCITQPLLDLKRALKKISDDVHEPEDEVELNSFISRAEAFTQGLDIILDMDLNDYVYWVDILNRPRGIKYSLSCAPVDVASEFREKVLDNICPVILTSATVCVNGSFDYIKESLGFGEDTDTIKLDSPFNYKDNVLLYLPHNMPDPGVDYVSYQKHAAGEIKNIVSLMNGRTFVLFTSFKMMDVVYDELMQEFPELRLLRQGDAPRYKLLEIFKNNRDAVLLGTLTFWQGIDVPGDALECVIISKLPFAVPDEPVVEAKMERIFSQDKNPFVEYQLPRAVIMFRQGFGRLIRTHNDRGMVAVIDPRIKTRSYGKSFMDVLPDCRHISNLEHAREFFCSCPA